MILTIFRIKCIFFWSFADVDILTYFVKSKKFGKVFNKENSHRDWAVYGTGSLEL